MRDFLEQEFEKLHQGLTHLDPYLVPISQFSLLSEGINKKVGINIFTGEQLRDRIFGAYLIAKADKLSKGDYFLQFVSSLLNTFMFGTKDYLAFEIVLGDLYDQVAKFDSDRTSLDDIRRFMRMEPDVLKSAVSANHQSRYQ